MRSNLYIKCKLNFKNWPGNFLKYRNSSFFIYWIDLFSFCYCRWRCRRLSKIQNCSKKLKMMELNQKNGKNTFPWQWNNLNILMTIDEIKRHHTKWKVEYFIRGFLRLVDIVVSNCVQVHQETSKKVQKKFRRNQSVDDFWLPKSTLVFVLHER